MTCVCTKMLSVVVLSKNFRVSCFFLCSTSAGRYEVDGYVYDKEEEPKFLMTGKCNEFMSFQPCDSEGEPTPGSELKEVRI